MKRIYNFNAGPAMLPALEVLGGTVELLRSAGQQYVDYEMSHRAPVVKINAEAEA